MAAAREMLSTTHSSATSFQGDNRQGSRKRKQNMPAASQTNFTTAPAGAVSQTPTDSIPQAQIDYQLSVTIKAVASTFDYPEAFVLSCALDMKNAGRTVNSLTLMDECDQQFLGEATRQKYAGSVDLQFGTSSSTLDSSRSALPCLPSQSSTNNCLESSQPANISSGSSTQNHHHSNNLPTKANELSGDSESNSYNHSTSHSAQHSSVADREHFGPGEDYVDGCPMPPVVGHFGSRAQSDSGSLKDFASSATALPCSPPTVAGSMVSNPESLNPSQPGPSNAHSVSDLTLTHLTDVTYTHKDVELESNSASAGRESVSSSSQTSAEFRKLCFELVEKEHALLEKSRLCSLCSTRPRDVTFLPCGHFTSCRSCAEPTYVCPCCNRSILATVDTYLS